MMELLGHKTLAMTMNLYAKMHAQTKRHAIARLPYGTCAMTPDHMLKYSPTARFPVQSGHQSVTVARMAERDSTQILMA